MEMALEELKRLWRELLVCNLLLLGGLLLLGRDLVPVLLGMALGWRIFRRRWSPRIVEEE